MSSEVELRGSIVRQKRLMGCDEAFISTSPVPVSINHHVVTNQDDNPMLRELAHNTELRMNMVFLRIRVVSERAERAWRLPTQAIATLE